MQDPMPYFKYRYVNILNKRIPCIETGGKIIHEIRDLEEFYRMFGYTPQASKAGLLPDEFIWSEYTNNAAADYSSCIQMHIVEYLGKHSDTFRQEYGTRWQNWLADHAKSREARGGGCVACRMRQLQKAPTP